MINKNKLSVDWRKVFEFISLLRVEPYLFVYHFIYTLTKVPTNQLIEDKLCLFVYKLNSSYCYALPEMSDEEDYLGKKSDILKEVTNVTLYMAILLTFPSIIASLFVGSWADSYSKAKKVLLIAGAITAICEGIILVLNIYFYDSSK